MGPPSQVTVIPGNHDAYVRAKWSETFALWSDYMNSDASNRPGGREVDGEIAFPSLRVRSHAAIIGVSTARPSGLFLAVGSVGKSQLKRLEKILEETAGQGLFRILLIHHPPLPGVVSKRKGLTDESALRSVLQRQGAELILHGHGHRTSIAPFEMPEGQIMAIGVPSASALGRKPGRRARYHLCRVERNAEGWKVSVSVRGYSRAEDRFVAEGEHRFTVSPKLPQRP
jgi:3',5'-cyclic AMP phosphodiesterase CpdA